MTRVGVVGIGAMGSRIAKRLCSAGNEVVVWNRSSGKVAAIVALGATAVRTPREAAARCETLITMVADPHALRAVSEGPAGLAAGAYAGLTVVEMSTVGPRAVQQLALLLPSGVGLVDAPVLGSITEAETGTLRIFAGGPDGLIDKIEPLLSELGTVLRVGPLGAGAAAKLVANAAYFGTLAVLGEAFAFAQAIGLGPETAAAVLASTPLAEQVKRRLPSISSRSYPRRFSLSLACKDADLIMAARVSTGVVVPLIEAAGNWLAAAEREGRGEQDYTAMLATILGQADTTGTDNETHVIGEAGGLDGLIVDLDGVVWLGDHPVEGAAAALQVLRDNGIQIVFLTNDPQLSREAQARRLTAIGVPTLPDDVFTAGSVSAAFLARQQQLDGAKTLVIGSDALRQDLADAGFDLVTTKEAQDAAIVVVGGHKSFDLSDLQAATVAVYSGAALYVTGRDPFVPTLNGREPGTGAIIAAIETATGVTATLTGKPEPHVFDMALTRLARCKRVAVVGDSIVSDVVGAKRAGLYSILVLTGATGEGELSHSIAKPDKVLASLAAVVDWLVTGPLLTA